MTSTLRFKKIYCDTKFKTPDSRSTSDFSIELPETMHFENNSVFYIDDAAIPHAWYTIETDINDKLYLYLFDPSISDRKWSFVITLSPGNYTGVDMKNEIQSKLTTATNSGLYTNVFTCTYNSMKNNLQIATNYSALSFYILSPDDLKTKLDGKFYISYNISNPHDCNEMLSNLDGPSDLSDYNNPFISGYLNMQPIRNLYLHSSSLGNLNNIGPRGENTIIKKIAVTADYNQMIFNDITVYNDYNSCAGQTLKKIDFQLKTSRGEIVPLHGCNMSFSIVFSRGDQDL